MASRETDVLFVADCRETADALVAWLSERDVVVDVVEREKHSGIFGWFWSLTSDDSEKVQVCISNPIQACRAEQLLDDLRRSKFLRKSKLTKLLPPEGRGWTWAQCESCARVSYFAEDKLGNVQDCLHCGTFLDLVEHDQLPDNTENHDHDDLQDLLALPMKSGLDVAEAENRFRELLSKAKFNISKPSPSLAWQVFKQFAAEPIACLHEELTFRWHGRLSHNEHVHYLQFARDCFVKHIETDTVRTERWVCKFYFRPTHDLPLDNQDDDYDEAEIDIWSSEFPTLAKFFFKVEQTPQFVAVLQLEPRSCNVDQYVIH